MRIILIGQAAFGATVFETLVKNGEHIVAVYTPPDAPGGRPDPLKESARVKGMPVVQPRSFKDDEVFVQYQLFQPDLTVMAFVTDIIPERYFLVPSQGAVNYHPSLLPRHRGASAINWAVIMGDDKTGLTIFWPDGGIDTGPILLQKEVPIGADDTTGSLYFNHLFPMGVDAMVESIDLIKKNKAPRIPQDEHDATYEPPCDDAVAGIDWHKPSRELYNLVRGCDPQPGAYIRHKGETLRFYGPQLIHGPSGEQPGTILRIDDAGILAAAAEGALLFAKIKGSGKKLSALEFAAAAGLQVGQVLGG
jgi:methionyl-tRNA formyltransferase